jgi:hypothetical protein
MVRNRVQPRVRWRGAPDIDGPNHPSWRLIERRGELTCGNQISIGHNGRVDPVRKRLALLLKSSDIASKQDKSIYAIGCKASRMMSSVSHFWSNPSMVL